MRTFKKLAKSLVRLFDGLHGFAFLPTDLKADQKRGETGFDRRSQRLFSAIVSKRSGCYQERRKETKPAHRRPSLPADLSWLTTTPTEHLPTCRFNCVGKEGIKATPGQLRFRQKFAQARRIFRHLEGDQFVKSSLYKFQRLGYNVVGSKGGVISGGHEVGWWAKEKMSPKKEGETIWRI